MGTLYVNKISSSSGSDLEVEVTISGSAGMMISGDAQFSNDLSVSGTLTTDKLKVNQLQSTTTTAHNVDMSGSIIVASGAANSADADGFGLVVSGANAHFVWEHSNTRMSLKQTDGTAVALNAGVVTAAGNISGTADLTVNRISGSARGMTTLGSAIFSHGTSILASGSIASATTVSGASSLAGAKLTINAVDVITQAGAVIAPTTVSGAGSISGQDLYINGGSAIVSSTKQIGNVTNVSSSQSLASSKLTINGVDVATQAGALVAATTVSGAGAIHGQTLGTPTSEFGHVYLGSGKHLQLGDTQAAWGIDSLTTSLTTLGYSTDYAAPVIDSKAKSFYFISSGETTMKPELVIKNTTNDGKGGFLIFTKDRGYNSGIESQRPAEKGDYFGGIAFMSSSTSYGEIALSASSTVEDAESGNIVLMAKNSGSLRTDIECRGGMTSIGPGKHIISMNQNIRFADSTDNTVIVELPWMIPANSIITSIAAVLKTQSNISTHKVNIQLSATGGTATDTRIVSETEILGAGVTNTDSSDSTSASDIDLKQSVGEVWICRDTVLVGSKTKVYICNAGTGNGTTNPVAGTLAISIEYYGNAPLT